MRFLIDADLPRAVLQVLRQAGHDGIDVRDIGLRSAKDEVIARHAREQGLCLLTHDRGFADIRRYPPAEHAGIVVLSNHPLDTREALCELLATWLERRDLVEAVVGQLAIVELGRVRMRR